MIRQTHKPVDFWIKIKKYSEIEKSFDDINYSPGFNNMMMGSCGKWIKCKRIGPPPMNHYHGEDFLWHREWVDATTEEVLCGYMKGNIVGKFLKSVIKRHIKKEAKLWQ